MANTLAAPADLTAFPGAPFDDDIVDAAVDAVRTAAGWHIAPVVSETVTVDAIGGVTLFLPTLRLTAVDEVRDLRGDTPVVLDGWRKSRSGMLSRAAYWPCGFETVEADITHGYATTPPALFAVIAEYCQMQSLNAGVRQESAGGESVSYSASGAITPESAAVLAKYTLPGIA